MHLQFDSGTTNSLARPDLSLLRLHAGYFIALRLLRPRRHLRRLQNPWTSH